MPNLRRGSPRISPAAIPMDTAPGAGCLLGEVVPTFLSPEHFSLRPTPSIQHCHTVLPLNSQLPQRPSPPSNTRS